MTRLQSFKVLFVGLVGLVVLGLVAYAIVNYGFGDWARFGAGVIGSWWFGGTVKTNTVNVKVNNGKVLQPGKPPKGYKYVKTQGGWILKKV